MSAYKNTRAFAAWLFRLPTWKRWALILGALLILLHPFIWPGEPRDLIYSAPANATTSTADPKYSQMSWERDQFKRKSNALYVCQLAMKRVARDPEKAEIPYVDVIDGKDIYMVAWGASTRMMRMRNGLGLEVAATGSCDVDKTSGQIVNLTLDGKQLLTKTKNR